MKIGRGKEKTVTETDNEKQKQIGIKKRETYVFVSLHCVRICWLLLCHSQLFTPGLARWFSDVSGQHHHLEGLLQSECLIQWTWGGARESAFLTSFQMMLEETIF